MGVPSSEVGYTSAMPRRGNHEVHKDMGGMGEKKKKPSAKQRLPQKENLQEDSLHLELLKTSNDYVRLLSEVLHLRDAT